MTKDELKKLKKKGSINDTIKPLKEDVFFENLIKIEELALKFGLSPKTIRNWVAKREIPFVRIKGRTYFLRHRIDAWIERKEFKPWL